MHVELTTLRNEMCFCAAAEVNPLESDAAQSTAREGVQHMVVMAVQCCQAAELCSINVWHDGLQQLWRECNEVVVAQSLDSLCCLALDGAERLFVGVELKFHDELKIEGCCCCMLPACW